MPDLMDPNYASEYPHQPYNGNPHMHPGELTLIRTIGQGRWQHPFHEHANHVRILARDGNLILSSPTTPISYPPGSLGRGFRADVQHRHHAGRGVRRDLLLHRQGIELGSVWSPSAASGTTAGTVRMPTETTGSLTCTPDVNGYNSGMPTALNYYGVVPGPQQAGTSGPVRRCGGGRSGDFARSECLHQRPMVRRQSLPRSGCEPCAAIACLQLLDHQRPTPTARTWLPSNTAGQPRQRAWLGVYVALA